MADDEENEFEYDKDEAAVVILDNISDELVEKLTESDLVTILDLKDEFLESINIINHSDKPNFCTYTADVDEDALDEYVITNALRHDIYLSKEEMKQVWYGEYVYMEKNGQIEDLPLEEMN